VNETRKLVHASGHESSLLRLDSERKWGWLGLRCQLSGGRPPSHQVGKVSGKCSTGSPANDTSTVSFRYALVSISSGPVESAASLQRPLGLVSPVARHQAEPRQRYPCSHESDPTQPSGAALHPPLSESSLRAIPVAPRLAGRARNKPLPCLPYKAVRLEI